MTSGLSKLRTWLNLQEASAYLSSEIGYDVYKGDILGLALDGKLQLSGETTATHESNPRLRGSRVGRAQEGY